MEGTSADACAFILAGGKSTRMGTDKAFVILGGRTLVSLALELAKSVTADVRIVGASPKFVTFAPVVEDVFRDCGPLGGIHAALRSSRSDLNLMLAVDLPFISRGLLQYLMERARTSPAASVTAVRAAGGWQPLCAVYRREFADIAEPALKQGRYKIDALFDSSRMQAVSEEELEAAGFSPGMFRNLNTPEDVVEAGKNRSAFEKAEILGGKERRSG